MVLRTALVVTLMAWSLVSPSAARGGAVPQGTDGIAVAVAGTGGIDFVAPDGSTVAALTSHPSDGDPVWSPGGSRLAFGSDRGGTTTLFVMSAAGVVRIAPNENLDWAWSSDGRWIAWVLHSEAKDLWVTDVAAGKSTNLTQGTREVRAPVWSPDSTLIAFESESDGGSDIFVITPDGGPMVNLTSNDAGNDRNPAWSPDGRELAFVTTQLVDHGDESGIYVMRSDGTGRELLVPGPDQPCERLGSVVWSPDGSRIAYSVDGSCGSPVTAGIEFYVADRPTGTPTVLGTGAGYGASGPMWSPTGKRLAFVTGGWGRKDLTIVAADGRNPVDVGSYFQGPVPPCTDHPTWSPDGSRLALVVRDSCVPMQETPPSVYITDGLAAPRLLAAGDTPAWRPATDQVGVVDPATGLWYLRGHPPFYYGNPSDIPFAGDWDCDGKDTPGLYRMSDAFVYLRNSNTVGVADVEFYFGNPDDVPLAGDFDGDGCDSVSLYRPSEQRFYIINSLGMNNRGLGVAEYSFLFGDPGDQPIVGDWDGDGIDEVGLHRKSTGYFYMRYSLTTGVTDSEFYFGDPGDLFVSGDWGVVDGIDSPAVFRADDATFYLRHTNTPGVADAEFPFGEAGWLPVAGSLEAS